MVDINIKVPALEKLLEMTASGFGAVAGPLLLRWNSHEQAGAFRRISQAQKEAAEIFKASGDITQITGEISLAEVVQSSVQFQQEKRMDNVASVVQAAKVELGDKEVPDKPTDHDWAARFFDNVKDVSSAELQAIWARILAGEVETPGRSSLRTLDILKNMTQEDAQMFERFACYLVFDEYSGRAAVFNPPWGGVLGGDELKERPMHDVKTCQAMQEIGLFMSADEDGWKGWGHIIQGVPHPASHGLGNHWGIKLTATPWTGAQPIKVPVISATRAGQELAEFLDDCPPHDQYLACLARCLHQQRGMLYAADIVGKDGSSNLLGSFREITGEWER